MKYIQCQTGTFVFEGNQIRYDLPLSKVHIHTYEEYREVTPIIPYAVPFTFESDVAADLFRIYFELEPGYIPFEQLRRQGMSVPLHHVISQLLLLGKYFVEQSQVYTIYEPVNLFVGPAGEVKALFRGVNGLFTTGSSTAPLEGIKQLILYLFSTASFGEIKAAGAEAWTKLPSAYANVGKKVIRASTWADLEEIDFGKIDVLPTSEKKPLSLEEKKPKGFRIQPKWIAISLGLLAIATPFLLPSEKSVDYAEPVTVQSKKPQPPELVNGFRYAAIEKYTAAAQEFAHVDFKALSKADQKVVLYTYLRTEQIQKALELDPNFAENVIQYKIEINQRKDILAINSDLPIIRFEQAAYRGDDSVMLSLHKQVPITDRRGRMIIRALIRQKRSAEVVPFAEGTKQADLVTYAKQRLGIS